MKTVTAILGDPRLRDVTKVDGVYSAEDIDAVERLRAALGELAGYRFRYLDDHARLLDDLREDPPELAFNFCDTGFRNRAAHELHVPALLELFDVPYTGSGPACLGLCFDKGNVTAIARDCGVPVPAQLFIEHDDALDAVDDPPLPAIVKPNRGDGGYGITQESVVHDAAGVRARIAALRELCPGEGVLVQSFLTGAEYGLTLIGNPGHGFLELPVMEVDYGGLEAGLPPILGYESKTLPDSPYWRQLKFTEATKLSPAVRAAMSEQARALFLRLGCRDYARFDFRADPAGVPRLLEVNPNPAWCWDGKMAFMAAFAGLSYADLLREILAAAERRVAG